MSTKAATLSTESIATSSPHPTGSSQSCAACGAPFAADQRYCLQCGERRVPVSSFLQAGPPAAAAPPSVPPLPPSPPGARQEGLAARNPALTLIAGVGVLLLAMGVGVLIGRSSSSAPRSAPAQVVTVGSAASGGTTGAGEAEFVSDWPSGKSGYTVQLQTLAETGTTISQVEAAKSAASGNGATAVGALKGEEFSSLTAGRYVIYSGVYAKKAEAQKALSKLKKNFSEAKVIKVSNGSEGGSGAGSKGSLSNPNDHSSIEKPAPPSVLEGESKAKGKSYEEKSRNLPDVVET